MRINHERALCTGEVPDFVRPLDAAVSIVVGASVEEAEPVVDEGGAVFARGAEVYEGDLGRRSVNAKTED